MQTQVSQQGRKVVYRRVSTTAQDTARQFDGWNFDLEFEDKLSGKNADRPQLQACLKELKEGDTLFIWELWRLGRNLEDVRRIVSELMERNISVKFQSEGLEFISSQDTMKLMLQKMMLTMLGAVGEYDLAFRNNAIREGIAAAKARGVKFGGAHPLQAPAQERVQRTLIARDTNHKEYIENARKSGMTFQQIALQMTMQGIKSPRGSELTGTSVHRMAKRLGILE